MGFRLWQLNFARSNAKAQSVKRIETKVVSAAFGYARESIQIVLVGNIAKTDRPALVVKCSYGKHFRHEVFFCG